jgi:hypothetical protein
MSRYKSGQSSNFQADNYDLTVQTWSPKAYHVTAGFKYAFPIAAMGMYSYVLCQNDVGLLVYR